MEEPYEGMDSIKKDDFDEIFLIRKLTASYVFCPKCGKKNTFIESSTGKQLIYFCDRCSAKLNDLWDVYLTGEMEPVVCRTCQQETFQNQKYCISCGSQQKRVVMKRSRAISSQIRDTSTELDPRADFVCSLWVYGLIDTLIGAIFGRETQREYRRWLIVLSSILCIVALIVVILWWFLFR